MEADLSGNVQMCQFICAWACCTFWRSDGIYLQQRHPLEVGLFASINRDKLMLRQEMESSLMEVLIAFYAGNKDADRQNKTKQNNENVL